jgi:hypothetical protein
MSEAVYQNRQQSAGCLKALNAILAASLGNLSDYLLLPVTADAERQQDALKAMLG